MKPDYFARSSTFSLIMLVLFLSPIVAFLYVREWFGNPINRGLFASFLVGLVIFWILLNVFCFIVTR